MYSIKPEPPKKGSKSGVTKGITSSATCLQHKANKTQAQGRALCGRRGMMQHL